LAETYQKVMFEIYREGAYNRRFTVVYFSELNDHNKDAEITHALDGEHFFDGYLAEATKKEAKQVITRALERLNDGEELTPGDLRRDLEPFLVD
jgi:hypothetical protein